MPTDLDPIATLRRTDPAAGQPVPERPSLDELATVPGALPHRPRAGSRVAALAAAILLVAALVGAAVVVGTRDEDRTPVATDPAPSTSAPAPAVDPPALIPLAEPAPARDQLLALADRAAADQTPVADAPIAYRRSVSWNRTTFVAPGDIGEEPAITGAGVVETVDEADDAPGPDTPVEVDEGEVDPADADVVEGDPLLLDSAHRESWIGDDKAGKVETGEGPPVRPGEVGQTDLDPARPTELSTTVWDEAYLDPPDLPDDPAIVDRYLQVEQGPASDFTYSLERAATLLGDRPRTGADRAAILRRLAEIEQVQYQGEVVDRAGRPSLAFSAQTDSHGGLSEVVILLDPETGVVNGREDVLLEGTDLEGDRPLLLWTETVLEIAHVAAVGDRPE